MINKPNIDVCLDLLNSNFSLVTVSDDKIPNIRWKEFQTSKVSQEKFKEFYNLKNTDGVGIITGYENLEVIDIDLKVYENQSDRDIFWAEYLSFLNDNIADFENKFVIVKTRNFGFHILYRCDKIVGNTKIAKLKDKKEAIIETRGIGGYVWIYDNFIQGNSYHDIKTIDENDRDILWTCSKFYNYVEETAQPEIKEFVNSKVSPWADYNQKVNIFDLVNSEFTIVRNLTDKIVIKRVGAQSPHSGYIYRNSNRMYLFSTGTIYPNEKLLSPFAVFAHKHFNGNFTEAGKKLYIDGYGSRANNSDYTKQILKNKLVIPEENIKELPFPVQIFPNILKQFVDEVGDNAGFSKDFLSCGVMSVISTIIGKKCEIKVNNTWFATPIFWFAIVGGPGSKKSHPVKFTINPLGKFDKVSKEAYDSEMEKYETYLEMSEAQQKEFRNENGKVRKPEFVQYIVKDATSEALFYVHNINQNGIMLYKDELIGWINAMGQYKGGRGDEMEKFLSMFDGDELKINRVTKEPLFLENTCMNLIGTIQYDVIGKIPKDNGLLHRFLFTNADKKIKRHSLKEVSKQTIQNYKDFLFNVKSIITTTAQSVVYELSPDALDEFCKVDSFLCDIQESDNTEPFIVEYCEKLKTYLPRFSLLIRLMDELANGDERNIPLVEKKHVELSFELVKYFLNTAKILFITNKKSREAREVTNMLNGKSTAEKIIELNKKGISKMQISKELEISRTTVYNVLNQNK